MALMTLGKTIRCSALALAALAFSVPLTASAAKFANQFIEFELPPQWQCNLEGAEWVCQSTNDAKKRDAIIILAAKLKGDQDSLDQYLNYLKSSKTYTSVQGKQTKSDPKYAKTIELNSHAWIDSLHMESEIPGFYTRYLATVKQDIGVLVTYSINKDKYQQYLPEFETMVRTLKVFRRAGGINAGAASGNLFDVKIPSGVSEGTVFAPIQGGSDAPKKKKEDDLPLPILVGAVAVIGYFLWRRKQNRG